MDGLKLSIKFAPGEALVHFDEGGNNCACVSYGGNVEHFAADIIKAVNMLLAEPNIRKLRHS